MNKAFTIAEIMIVLVVIGILTGILLPVAFHSLPNENVMKFKKAHATLYRVISELVNSDKYYLDGDLGVKPNGDLIDGTHEGDYTYLCNSIADILSTKSVNCIDTNEGGWGIVRHKESWTTNTLDKVKLAIDKNCKGFKIVAMQNEIITADNVHYYEVNSNLPFGISKENALTILNGDFAEVGRMYRVIGNDGSSFDDINYKIFCIDVDGIPKGGDGGCNEVNDICPFGYGIRVDGKIIPGARADEWLKKSIQEKE